MTSTGSSFSGHNVPSLPCHSPLQIDILCLWPIGSAQLCGHAFDPTASITTQIRDLETVEIRGVDFEAATCPQKLTFVFEFSLE